MTREIESPLYRIKFYDDSFRYVESDSLDYLFRYIIEKYILKGYMISSFTKIESNGSLTRIPLYSDTRFKRLMINYQNFSYAVEKLQEKGYNVELRSEASARVYFPGYICRTTELSICDEIRQGYVMIEGRVQNIDEWLEA